MILYGWSYVSSVAVGVQVSELSTEGQYPNTLCAVDIATDWVACRAVLGKGQQRVGGAIHRIGQTLPFPLLGLDSDNGSEFINHHL